MSLEAVLEAHTSALQENTSVMNQLVAAWKALTTNAKAIQPGEPFTAGGVPMARSPEADHQAAKADVAARRAAVNVGVPAASTPDVANVTTVATHLAPGRATANVQTPKSVAASQPTETAAATPASKPEVSSPAPSTVTYDEVKTLVLRVSKDKGRDAAAAVLSGFGVAKAPELKPEQYADAVAQLKAALA